MKAKPIQVELRSSGGDGAEPRRTVDADLVVCPECDGECFTIYFIDEHQHVQCQYCMTTFCGKAEACAAGLVN